MPTLEGLYLWVRKNKFKLTRGSYTRKPHLMSAIEEGG